ncbi:MAG: hypothetical protein HYR84_12120 [Planctomycetes bacterium]|nr:hypothetical protein [Planctomycetota bacterium]
MGLALTGVANLAGVRFAEELRGAKSKTGPINTVHNARKIIQRNSIIVESFFFACHLESGGNADEKYRWICFTQTECRRRANLRKIVITAIQVTGSD